MRQLVNKKKTELETYKTKDASMYYGYGVPIPKPKFWCTPILKAFYSAEKPVSYDPFREKIWQEMNLTKKQIDCPTRTGMRRGVDVLAESAIMILCEMGFLRHKGTERSSYYVNVETRKPSMVPTYAITKAGKEVIKSGKIIDDAFVTNLVESHPKNENNWFILDMWK